MTYYEPKTANTVAELNKWLTAEKSVIFLKEDAYEAFSDRIVDIEEKQKSAKKWKYAPIVALAGVVALPFTAGAALLVLAGTGIVTLTKQSKNELKKYTFYSVDKEKKEIIIVHKRYDQRIDTF